jgi:pimeloyl-ACP methyl ester carboxylesterase
MADSLTSEVRAFSEFAALRRDAVYRGEGVPRGDGRVVLVLPGLFGNDTYLRPLRAWLHRVGYLPSASLIAFNAGCPERVKARAYEHLVKRLAPEDSEVAIVGHSRGGMLGKAIAARLGGRCTCFVALGSPLGALRRAGRPGLEAMAAGQGATPREDLAAGTVVNAGRHVLRWLSPHCDFPRCGCDYVDELLAPWPESLRRYAIYSVEDPVVAPQACRLDGAVNIEVRGSHAGLVANATVYRHLARVLAGQI